MGGGHLEKILTKRPVSEKLAEKKFDKIITFSFVLARLVVKQSFFPIGHAIRDVEDTENMLK